MGDITAYPKEYEAKIRDMQGGIPEPTYELSHKLVAQIEDFDLQGYFDKFDWDNIPNDAEYNSSLKVLQESNKSTEVYIKLLDDEFTECIVDLVENKLGMTVYELQLMRQPKGSLSLNHVDYHGNFRMRNKMWDKIPDDKVYDVVKRYWIACTDRKHGQYFEVNGHQIIWKAGEVYQFSGGVPHCGGTLAEDPRIFVIITGIDVDPETL